MTDSACDLPDQVANELGIQIVPLSIRFGGDEFVDRQDLTPAEFWQRCNASAVLPETAAPAPVRSRRPTAGWPPRAPPAW
ncbi:MAG: DegV family protein [Ilumatobacteraceae bacterium]